MPAKRIRKTSVGQAALFNTIEKLSEAIEHSIVHLADTAASVRTARRAAVAPTSSLEAVGAFALVVLAALAGSAVDRDAA